MSAPLRRLADFLAYTHLWLGVGAVSQAGLAVLYAGTLYHGGRGEMLGSGLYLAVVLTGTVALYGAHRLIGLRRLRRERLVGRWRVIARQAHAIRTLSLVCGAVALLLIALLPWAWQWRLLLPGAVGLLYVVPVVGRARLRDLGVLKAFFLSVGWVGVTAWVPLAAIADGQSPQPGLPPAAMWIVCGERLLFMLGHSLAFDYRDIAFDVRDSVWTLPARLGRRATRALSVALVGLSVAVIARYPLADGSILDPAVYLAATSLLALPLLWRTFRDPRPSDAYFALVLDGLFALPGILLLCRVLAVVA